MYKSINAVEMAIAAAESPDGAVMRDRARFTPFFEAAERYVHEHDLIVGGDTATRLLLGNPLGPEDYFYELYSSRALDDARALTAILYGLDPEGLGHYANMTTGVPRKEFSINVDERTLFRVKALEIHRGARAADIIVPSLRPSDFARDPGGKPLMLQCMGPEIQLMDVYAALTNPARAGEWPSLLRAEERLRGMYTEEVRDKIKAVGDETQGGEEELPTSALIAALASEYVPRSGHAAVGGYAVRSLEAGGADGCQPRLQLVTSNTFREEEQAVTRIASRLGFNVQSTKNEPKVPTDDRLRRMTMYILRPGSRREPFLDVYNPGEYELVPFVGTPPPTGGRAAPRRRGPERTRSPRPKAAPSGVEALPPGAPVGTPFVVLRFLLVDAWTIQLLFRMGVTSAQYTRQVLRELLAGFERAAAAYLRLREAGSFEAIFPLGVDSYIGSYVDPIRHQKRQRFGPAAKEAARGKRMYYPPYYPARDAEAAGEK
jgi:hypothetical protein